MPIGKTVLVRLVKNLLDRAQELGLDPSELARDAGLEGVELLHPDARVSLSKEILLWRLISAATPDHSFGINAGAKVQARDLGVLGYSMYFSSSLRKALMRATRYFRILTGAVSLSMTSHPRHYVMLVESPFDIGIHLRHVVDMRMAVILSVAREITAEEVLPAWVEFPYARPATIRDHERFFRCPIRFSQPTARLVLRDKDADLPVVRGDNTLVGYLDQYAEGVLRTLVGEGSVPDRMRAAIWADLSSGVPTVETVASMLGTSPRTLQRNLRSEGTCFRRVLDDMRREMSEACLRDRKLSVSDVAFLGGYRDTASFHRAFKRWTGMSPSQYRKTRVRGQT